MRTNTACKWTFLFAFAPIVLFPADVGPPRLTWAEFSAKLTPKHTVRMVLPDGTHIEGAVRQVKPDALDIHVTRTSNRQTHPKGDATIPRESLSVVDVRSPRWKGKLIGTLVPIGAGAAILAAGIAQDQGLDAVYEIAAAGGLTIAIGAPAGFFVGRAVDRRFEQFVIVREPRSGADH